MGSFSLLADAQALGFLLGCFVADMRIRFGDCRLDKWVGLEEREE